MINVFLGVDELICKNLQVFVSIVSNPYLIQLQRKIKTITKENKNTTGGLVKVGGKIIESKKSDKNLGIMIDNRLNFQEQDRKSVKRNGMQN